MEMCSVKSHQYAFQNDRRVSRAYQNRSHSGLVGMLNIPLVYACYTMRRACSELVSTYCHYGAPCLHLLSPWHSCKHNVGVQTFALHSLGQL